MAYRSRPRSIAMYTSSLLFLLWSIFLGPLQIVAASAPKPPNVVVKNTYTITMAQSNAILANPGQGWALYGSPDDQSAATLAYASVGYKRYNWSDIEPKEGMYNWAFIDSDFTAWRLLGKMFAFGVMNANSSTPTNAYVTPKWVFDDGAHSVKS